MRLYIQTEVMCCKFNEPKDVKPCDPNCEVALLTMALNIGGKCLHQRERQYIEWPEPEVVTHDESGPSMTPKQREEFVLWYAANKPGGGEK